MKGVVNLEFADTLEHLGITGTAPKTIVPPTGTIPQAGDVLGFSQLRFNDGRAAMFRVQNRFYSVDEDGDITHIHLWLAVIADQSFVSE